MKDEEKQFEDFVSGMKFDDAPNPAHRDKLEAELLAAMQNQPRQENRPIQVWRIIMKSKITKLAAAAVIVIAATFGLTTVFNKSVSTAYAIEQTIEAIRSKTTVHMLCRDWEGHKLEIWTTLSPKSGLPDYMYLDYPRYDALVISTPEISYTYLEKTNLVQIDKGQQLYFDVRFEKIVEDIATEIAKMKGRGKIEIYPENDPNTGKNITVMMVEDEKNVIRLITDPETKLPVSINFIKSDQLGNLVKDFDEIYFYKKLPEGIFEFQIPRDAVVVDRRNVGDELENDPNYGIAADGMSQEEATAKVVEEYWQALIHFDLERLGKVYPGAIKYADKIREAFNALFQGNMPAELVETGQPQMQYGCTIGPVVSCIVKCKDGSLKEVKLIIKFRTIDGKSSCVVAGMFGSPEEVEP